MNTLESAELSAELLSVLLCKLAGGVIVGWHKGSSTSGSLDFLVEHRALPALLPDSWGRVIVRLMGCRNVALQPGATPHGAELRGASCTAGVHELRFAHGKRHGLLRFEADSCRFTLGSGREMSLRELAKELGLKVA